MHSILFYLDLDECDSDPCENGGDCKNGDNSYSCICEPGYLGINCETGKTITHIEENDVMSDIYS